MVGETGMVKAHQGILWELQRLVITQATVLQTDAVTYCTEADDVCTYVRQVCLKRFSSPVPTLRESFALTLGGIFMKL